ncbi:phage major capsid protein [Falsirhodobacter halotolerans]|uniref:phage major capsid protein n=1 Tax=Falsirhodobacter halotolerans TaxID=1146892 RepID=UPI001FD365E6|nr:phage major capsid protein [Falsirhodobacter halotolerans]MCJ8139361.1 phage major capsid protein [Falsirhodobacter halotolerans]
MPKHIADLRRKRTASAQRMETASATIAGLEADNTAADDAAMVAAITEFEAAQAEFTALGVSLQRAETTEAALAAAATGGDQNQPNTPAAPSATTPATPADPAMAGVELGFMVHALARHGGRRADAAADLEAQGHSGLSAALSGAEQSAGGVTIPRPQAEGLIALLRPRVVVRAAGARTFPMPAGQMRHAKQIAPATASYIAENAPIPPSEPAFGAMDMGFKKLTGLVPIGNSLLRHSGIAMAQAVRDDLLNVMALREDLAFLRGAGGLVPTGLRSWIPARLWLTTAAATPGSAETMLRTAVSRVEDAGVGMINPSWVMRGGAKNWLANLRDPIGFKLFPSIEQNGTLLGYPIRTTAQIPDNLGEDGNETEIYFGDFNEAMIGDSMVLQIGSSTEAAYIDSKGDMISAFQNDLTLMRAISEHDFATARDEAFCGFNAVGWSL